jgi:hypothetical protein
MRSRQPGVSSNSKTAGNSVGLSFLRGTSLKMDRSELLYRSKDQMRIGEAAKKTTRSRGASTILDDTIHGPPKRSLK